MKFFSRKALVAAAAAATISFGGAGAAMAAETPAAATSATATATATETPEKEGSSSSSFDDIEAKDVKEWIGVATAIITALGALFGFVNKYLKIF